MGQNQYLIFRNGITKNYTKSLLSNKCRAVDFKRAKIVACKPRPNYRVWIRFDDGLEGEVDLHELVEQGVFAAWESIEFFNQVRIEPKTDILSWGEEIDLDPYVLRDKILRKD